jgi:hypothetical protein
MGVWQSQQQLTPQSAAQQQRAAAAASPAAEQGSEPTLELAGAASQGGQTNALEDATLEDFALPPDLAAGEERPITMPFSGAHKQHTLWSSATCCLCECGFPAALCFVWMVVVPQLHTA